MDKHLPVLRGRVLPASTSQAQFNGSATPKARGEYIFVSLPHALEKCPALQTLEARRITTDEPPQQRARNPAFLRLVLELKVGLAPQERSNQMTLPVMHLIGENLQDQKELMDRRGLQLKGGPRGSPIQREKMFEFGYGVRSKLLLLMKREAGTQRFEVHQGLVVHYRRHYLLLRRNKRNHHVSQNPDQMASKVIMLTRLHISALEASSNTCRTYESASRCPCLQTPSLVFTASVARAATVERIDVKCTRNCNTG